MKVTAERIPESKVLLRIEIPPEQVEQAIERTYRDLARRMRIPGFRPGKAPRPIVERYLGGADSIQQEGLDRLIDESYRKALVETHTHAIGEPDILERPEFKPGESFVIEASVPVVPTVELGDYQSIRMPLVDVEATSDQVDSFIESLREQNAEWTTVERGVQNGDTVTVDVVGTAGSVPTLYGPSGDAILQTQGGKEVYNVKDHAHQVNVEGTSEFAPGFDEELIGLKAGDEKRFGLTLPSDHADPLLANQSIVFNVVVHEVKEKHLPELDGEFATKVGAGDTVDQLRETVREMIQRRLEQEARQAYENSLLAVAVERSQVEVPEVMVQSQIDSELEEMKADLSRQRVGWVEYLQAINRSEESLRADMHDSAARSLRSYLVLREIARREGVQVLLEEVTAEINATAEQFGRAAALVRERLNTREQRERIEGRILHRKAMDRLVEIAKQAKPDEPTPTGEDSPAGEITAEEGSVERVPTSDVEVTADAAPTAEEPTTEESTRHG